MNMNFYVYYYGGNQKGCDIKSLDEVLSSEAMFDKLEHNGELVIISPFTDGEDKIDEENKEEYKCGRKPEECNLNHPCENYLFNL